MSQQSTDHRSLNDLYFGQNTGLQRAQDPPAKDAPKERWFQIQLSDDGKRWDSIDAPINTTAESRLLDMALDVTKRAFNAPGYSHWRIVEVPPPVVGRVVWEGRFQP